MIRNNKKGSTTVFLVFILSAMVGVAAMFVYTAKQSAYTGIGDGALNLGMRSVLSEFDPELKERYGLMAFNKSRMEASLDISDYTSYAFKGTDPVKEIKVTYDGYRLSETAVLEQQILEHMKFKMVEGVFLDKKRNSQRNITSERTLRNESIIKTLPSKPFAEEQPGFLEKLDTWKDRLDSTEDIFDKTKDSYIMDSYIMDHFKYGTGGPVDEKTFFEHEIEYIIVGKYSDEKNKDTVSKGLKLLRTGLNTAFIYSDKERRSMTLAAAELLTPETAPATQAVLIATWAAAEAENDVKLLLKGKPVPLMKDDMSWATDLNDVLENITEDCIDTGNEKGLYYSDYLMIFLHFQNKELKLSRIADLIQINMKGNCDREFMIREYNTGMKLSARIYGRTMEYETCY